MLYNLDGGVPAPRAFKCAPLVAWRIGLICGNYTCVPQWAPFEWKNSARNEFQISALLRRCEGVSLITANKTAMSAFGPQRTLVGASEHVR
jgi:hypothetical protein